MGVSAPPTGHVTDVTAVTFAPGGDILATADDDGTVLLCDVTDPAHFRHLGTPLTGHTSAVSDVAFASDGHTLATASDSTVILWDTTGLTRLLAQPLDVPGQDVGDGRSGLNAGEPPSGVWLVEGPHPLGGSCVPR